ncbi:MAG: LEA type 2 family protein [Phycisphaerales bacterium]
MLGGCSKALSPTFTAVGVRELERNNDRSVIEFIIEAKNPNREPIPLKEIQYAVTIDGQEVFTGLRSPEVSLHTYATQTFTLPAVLPMNTVGSAGEIQYRLNGSVEYIPPGRLAEVLFDAKLEVPEAPIDLSGTINLGSDLQSDE